jgi:predicted aspartyl protease
MMRVVCAVVALLALAGCADLTDMSCGQSPVAVVPVQIVDGIPLVSVSLKGRQATLILDTGAQTFVLTEAAVARLGLVTHSSAPIEVSGTGGRSRRFAAVLTGIEIAPGFRLPDTYSAVLPTSLPSPGGITVDGLLGVGVLNRWEIDLDMPASRMVLHEGHACPGPPAVLADAVELRNIATQGGRFVIPVTLDDRSLAALIDTGSQGSIVSRDAAAGAGVTDVMLAADPAQLLVGVGADRVEARRHRFREIRIGVDVAPEPMLTVMPANQGSNEAILGFNYLRHRRLWLSAVRNLVFIGRDDTR